MKAPLPLYYEDATIAELAAHTNGPRGTGRVLVSFPYNDYLTRKARRGWDGSIVSYGKVRTYAPMRHLKLLTDKHGSYVRFDGRKWDITGVKALVKPNEDGTTYRHLMVTTINARN